MVASQTLRAALTKAEQTNPGLTYELVKGIIRKFPALHFILSSPTSNVQLMHSTSPSTDKGNLNVNMYESVLRLQGAQQALSDTSDCEYSVPPEVNANCEANWIQWTMNHGFSVFFPLFSGSSRLPTSCL